MKVIVNGQLLNYRDSGTGKTILLLHGWGAKLETFDALADKLEQQYRVLAIDFPGFGGSPKPATDWSVDDYAKLVKDFLKKRSIGQLYAVIGHSFGGRVILKSVGEGYIRPQKVVLIGSAGIKSAESVRKGMYKIVAKIGARVMKLPGLKRLSGRARKNFYERAGSTDYLHAAELQNIFLNVINEDLLGCASKISQPSLLLWGENDDSTPLSDAKKLQVAIPNSRLEVIAGAGHFVYLEKLNESFAKLENFLS